MKSSLLRKRDRYNDNINNLIQTYGSKANLTVQRNLYRQTKCEIYHQADKDSKKLQYYEKMLKLANEQLRDEANMPQDARISPPEESKAPESANSNINENPYGYLEEDSYASDKSTDSSSSSENSSDDPSNTIELMSCDNCNRENSLNSHEITFVLTRSDSIKRRKFKNFQLSRTQINEHSLCRNCHLYLTSLDKNEVQQNAWPGFLWKFLTNKDVMTVYGCSIWSLLPTEFRSWYMRNLKLLEPETYATITLEFPETSIKDITNDLKEWDDLIKSMTLPNLSKACNTYMIPKILCPFGCSEFMHKKGYLPMDLVFQRYLPKVIIETYSDRKDLANIVHAREDFLELREKKVSKWVLNDDWKVLPTLAIIKGTPVILTCRDHHKGSKNFHIHVCKQPNHNLSSSKTDQLCHGVLKPRTIKQQQKSIYSNSFQMHEQRGSFNGIDTCAISDFHNFSFRSKLQSEAESRCLINRPDTNSLLSQLQKDKKISNIIASDKKKLAKRLYENFDFKPYKYGATYVPLEIAMMFQKEINVPYLDVVIDDRRNSQGELLPEITIKNKRYWQPSLYPCQKATKWGATTLSLPSFKNAACTKSIWIVSSMIISVDALYSMICQESSFRKSDWKGWLLTYINKTSVNNLKRSQGREEVFKWKYVNTIDRIIEKFPCDQSIFQTMEEIEGVKCINMDEQMEEEDFEVIASAFEVLPKILITYPNNEYNNGHLIVGENIYELRYIAHVWDITNHKWDGEVYMRHGQHFPNWFYCRRNDIMIRQIDGIPPIQMNSELIFLYVKQEDKKIDHLKESFLRSIGGQTKVFCNQHKLPLIRSFERRNKCNCGKLEYLQCSVFDCGVNICKVCYNNYSTGDKAFVDTNDMEEIEDELECDLPEDNSVEFTITVDSDSETEGGDEQLKNYLLPNQEGVFEKDDFDHFVTCNFDPDLDLDGDKEEIMIQTTDAGEVAYDVTDDIASKGVLRDVTINGHTILNQCGSLLTRKKHDLKGSNKQQFFLQKICSTSHGNSIPLLYPEGTVIPSIYYSAAPDNYSLLGAMPSPLLAEGVHRFGFQDIPKHQRSNCTNPHSSTSSNARYIALCYDTAVNLAANKEDTRCIINNGLTVAEDKMGGLGLRGKDDSTLLESVDSKAMVRNLCSSQIYHKQDVFLTFTNNTKKHFGTKVVKLYIDEGSWKKNITDYEDLDLLEKKEMEDSINQASSVLLVRIWQEVCSLFLDYLRKSPSSPYKSVRSLFARFEYQKLRGNLSHIHLLLEVNWKKLPNVNKDFLLELVRASVLEVVRSDEVNRLIADGTFKDDGDWKETINDGIMFLPHQCNSGCQKKVEVDGKIEYKCRKINNLKASKDNTRHTFQTLPNDIPNECIERLIQIGLADEIEVNDNGYQKRFQSCLSLFHPKRHIPRTNPNGDLNISPVEGYTSANCRSMQNIQILTQCGGVNKYVNKYIAKIDEQNYVVVSTNQQRNGELVLRKEFIHNSKVSQHAENKERDALRDRKHPQGRVIGLLEMVHMLLKYPEVITNLRFVPIQTIPLEMRNGIKIEKNREAEDGINLGSLSHSIRNMKNLPNWRQHRENELMMINDLQNSKVSIDKISLFSLRPPELRHIIKKPGQYYRWFIVKTKVLKGGKINELLDINLQNSAWIDGLQHQVFVRRKALPEIMELCVKLNREDVNSPIHQMKEHFESISSELAAEDPLDEEFRIHIKKNLVEEEDGYEHLPCPVFSYINPALSQSFLHHVMLSMGEYETEIDLHMHDSIRNALRYCKLIGSHNDEDSLKEYSNNLLKRWIIEQLQYYPNALKILSSWIVIAGNLFDSVIIKEEIPMSEMPSVQLSSLFGNNEEAVEEYLNDIKATLIDAIFEELGEETLHSCQIPPKTELMATTKEEPSEWEGYEKFTRNASQSNDSFIEQKFAIKTCFQVIDEYCNWMDLDTYTKNICIRGFPGSGKTWCSTYCGIYAISRGLKVVTTALLAKRAIQLGGVHYHKLFCLPIGKNMSIHRKAELAILKLLKNPRQLNLLLTLDILICDEMGQMSAEFLTTIDIILRRLRDRNTYLGGVLIIGTIDHTQINPIEGRPFLTSSAIITCFRMVALNYSVRAGTDVPFQRIQEIVRKNHRELESNRNLITELINLCSNHLTFVDDWNDSRILPQAMRLYTKKVPAREAAKAFERRVRQHINPHELRQKLAEDSEKAKFSQMEWRRASEKSSIQLDSSRKEPRSILFFKGAIYECTYNCPQGTFTQSQIAILIELPTMEALDKFEKIKFLVAPPGLKEVTYNKCNTKEYYLNDGFREVRVGAAPEHNLTVQSTMFAKRKQYGLRHRVVMTVHSAQGDTLPMIVTKLSPHDKKFSMWDKGQLVVILSRTKQARDSIFVGPKHETIEAFRQLVTKKTQWSDYMERVLEIITVNRNEIEESRIITTATFPYKIKDVCLPQCDSGFVYMLMSMRMKSFIYIGTTKSIRKRLRAHNAGYGSTSTEPNYLRPYALIAYICGFGGGRSDLRFYLENKWKEKRDEIMRQNGASDIRTIAMSANTIIHSLNEGQFGIAPSELTLVCLFN